MPVLVILIILALLLGVVGAVIEGLLWILLIGIALGAAAVGYGWLKVRGSRA